MSKDYEIVNPGASAMIESLRAYGYSLNTAIADLIDNSISAHARNIWIRMHWSGNASWISILDDGDGMDEDMLSNAMRPGSQNPLEQRSDEDLGRFGLGLKTASFSQCRSLTVVSRPAESEMSTRRWDLDYVGRKDQWRLLKDARQESAVRIADLERVDHGTLVLLEEMDRICAGQSAGNEAQQRRFMDRISSLSLHLSMVFHRFMEGQKPLRIYINGQGDGHRLKPWDPFLVQHNAIRPQPLEKKSFHDGVVEVQGFVLPHKDKLGPADHEAAGGPAGWNDQQGFYVYRNKRLLVAGSWLGLGGRRQGWTKEEHYKLARIRIDIPNRMDSTWQIDVKKSRAKPPDLAAEWLENYAKNVRNEAREAFSHRGRYGNRPKNTEISRLWTSATRSGGQLYRIDRNNPLIKNLLKKSGSMKQELENLFKLLEETVPVQQIWLDMAEHPERTNDPMGGLNEENTMKIVDMTMQTLAGVDRAPTAETVDYVCRMEAFTAHESLIRAKYPGDGV
ncbi:ATP-binding protein [Pseudomonadota bacterium]